MAKHTCPAEEGGPPIIPIVGNLNFHQFAIILGGACTILTCLLAGFLIFQHAINYTFPVRQRQIIRIVSLIPFISIASFLCVWLEGAAHYIEPAMDVGTSFALASFLLFLCDLVISNPQGFDELFGNGALVKGPFGSESPPWLKASTASGKIYRGPHQLTELLEDLVLGTPIHSPQQHSLVGYRYFIGCRNVLR